MKYLLKPTHYFLLISIFSIVISSCSKEDENDSNTENKLETQEYFDVSYGEEALQNFDIYLPSNRNKTSTKTLILVHGGSWVSGDKNEMNSYVNQLKSTFSEYAIVNMNYQLATIGKSPFPMQINDLSSLINYLKLNASKFQISDRFGFIGVSAGGHLSLLYSYAYDPNNYIEMVCSIVGPTNFLDENYLSNPNFSQIVQGVELITGVSLTTNSEYYESLSPLYMVDENAPATILFYGGKDDLIPSTQGKDLHQKLNELEVINEFNFYENEGHGWNGPELQDTFLKLNSFIKTNF